MKRSNDITRLLRCFDGPLLSAHELPDGSFTIGYNHTYCVTKGQRITLVKANEYLNKDLETADYFVNRLVDLELNQTEYDVLVDFVFMVGPVRFQQSPLPEMINTGHYDCASMYISAYRNCIASQLASIFKAKFLESQNQVSV